MITPTQLVERREALGLSQAEIAELAGLTGAYRRMTVSSWETGKRQISPPCAMLLEMNLDRLERLKPDELERERERLREQAGLSPHRGRINAGVR